MKRSGEIDITSAPQLAAQLDNGWRLRFPDAGDALVRVLQGCGWTEHPRLELS